MADEKVRKVQQWLNTNYALGVDEDGYTGNKTVTALIKALQTELGLSADGSFGPGTVTTFNTTFPNGLQVETNPTSQNIKNIIYILRGGMYCRGINGGDLDSDDSYKFDTALSNDIIFMKGLLGIDNPTNTTNAIEMKAVLTTDAYTLISSGDSNVRTIQQNLNKKYLSIIGSYLATNGLYERYTNIAIKKAIQYEIGVTPDGSWGDGTKAKLPALSKGSTKKNLVYLAQYLLYLNGFDPNGFDGSFGNGATNATKSFQSLMHMTVDGSIGPQTWFALAVSCGDTSRSANACDTTAEITTSRAQALLNAGYEVVGRYINLNSWKGLQSGELQTILNSGLKAFFIYQESNNSLDCFSYEHGVSQGTAASKAANYHKLPKNTVIYFAVDLDVYAEQIESYILPFFRGIHHALSPNYRVGIYGPRLVCQKIAEAGLSVSSFVADMSSGFSCNIGQKMPTDWCYDQFKEISNFNSDFAIDKVTYSAQIPACNSIQTGDVEISDNSDTYDILTNLYNLAGTYLQEKGMSDTVYNKNILVLQFFRAKDYHDAKWTALIGDYDHSWVDYVFAHTDLTDNGRYNIHLKISNQKEIGLIHLSVVIEGLMKSNTSAGMSSNSTLKATSDLIGWAGDLISMTASLAEAYASVGMPSKAVIMSHIGDTNSDVYKFPLEDLIQDIDAVNLFKQLYNTRIDTIFKNYYNNGQYNRYNDFFTAFVQREGTSAASMYYFWYDLAYVYINKQPGTIAGLLGGAFALIIEGSLYSTTTWADPVADAFASKMCHLLGVNEADDLV